MRKANRETLKNFFKSGRMPSQQDFADLIDSMLNMVDEGFDKTPKEGLKISQLGENTALISFYSPRNSKEPEWMMTCDQSSDERLILQKNDDKPVLILSRDRKKNRVGIGQEKPKHTLDVSGVIAAKGRTGKQVYATADGKWQTIVENIKGCIALEIMAGIGKPGSGRYALLRATALNTYHPGGFWTNLLNRKRAIRRQHAYYSSRCDRILLKWHREQNSKTYSLKLKTRSDYGEGIKVKCTVTGLWFDHEMQHCSGEGKPTEPIDWMDLLRKL